MSAQEQDWQDDQERDRSAEQQRESEQLLDSRADGSLRGRHAAGPRERGRRRRPRTMKAKTLFYAGVGYASFNAGKLLAKGRVARAVHDLRSGRYRRQVRRHA